jgi:hypothetical protein
MENNLDILFSDEFRRSVEANFDREPLKIALDGRVPNAAMVASQVKYLRRAEGKLPSYHAARCILPSRAFEQSSSEAVAARKSYSGVVAVDLTCGLGVDALALSKRFERVIAIERDATLAAIARENFRRLGAHNIEVVNSSAEEFLNTADLRADLVYADPDRRDAVGRKMVRLEDCSPDIVALLPRIERIAPRLAVKLSPLFDVDELFRVFGPGTTVEVVSFGGECKEVIANIRFDAQIPPVVRAVAIGIGEVEYPRGEVRQAVAPAPVQIFEPERYRCLVVPDVALQKARLARRYLSERGVWIDSDNGYGFAAELPSGDGRSVIMGKVLEIESIEPFDPKALKRRLKSDGIRSIDILKREFPLTAADIARQSGVREGGATKIAFTRAAGLLWQIAIKS